MLEEEQKADMLLARCYISINGPTLHAKKIIDGLYLHQRTVVFLLSMASLRGNMIHRDTPVVAAAEVLVELLGIVRG